MTAVKAIAFEYGGHTAAFLVAQPPHQKADCTQWLPAQRARQTAVPGAVVLIDTRRLAYSFPVVDYFDSAGIPYVIAINGFGGSYPHHPADVAEALSVPPRVPLIQCDARDRHSAKAALVRLVQHAMTGQPGKPESARHDCHLHELPQQENPEMRGVQHGT
jgi:signal recognition particle receptor subunit beta